MRSQHQRDIPLFILGWLLTIVAAGIVLYAAWFVLSAFLGMAGYIQSMP